MTTLTACQMPAICVAQWVEWLQKQHPTLVKAMRACDHHYHHQHLNKWHLEGDVWSHTMLVAQSYAMTGIEDVCVGLTALLHDIGKPHAKFALHDRQRLLFRGHESLSAWMTWGLLQEKALNLSLTQRLTIFTLVALHGSLYLDWFHQEDRHDVTKIAQAFHGFGTEFWQKLILQIQNDMQGQITKTTNQKADLLAMSSAVIEAFGHHNSHLVHQTDAISIVFFIGLPGAGKSSFRQAYLDQGFTLISRDDQLHQVTQETNYRSAWKKHKADASISLQIDQALNDKLAQAIAQKRPIVIDMTNLSRKARQNWLSRLPQHYRPQALLFVTDYDTLYQRNAQRGDKTLPNHVIHNMMLSFEHPLFDEFAQIDYVIDGKIHRLSVT